MDFVIVDRNPLGGWLMNFLRLMKDAVTYNISFSQRPAGTVQLRNRKRIGRSSGNQLCRNKKENNDQGLAHKKRSAYKTQTVLKGFFISYCFPEPTRVTKPVVL